LWVWAKTESPDWEVLMKTRKFIERTFAELRLHAFLDCYFRGFCLYETVYQISKLLTKKKKKKKSELDLSRLVSIFILLLFFFIFYFSGSDIFFSIFSSIFCELTGPD
jgi:hypothetical protein